MVMIITKFLRFYPKSEIKKLKTNNISIENYEKMMKVPDFEQNYYSRTAIGNFRIGHVIIRIVTWLAYHDKNYGNINYLIY